MKPLVIFHANCADGFCAAWIANHALTEAEFLPANYGDVPPDVKGRGVYILDFSYKRPIMEQMQEDADYLIVCDHHKTAAADLEGFGTPATVFFDMNKSGGRLTWEHFHPGESAPWLVDYTEDRDLWRWKLPHSREVSAALASYPRTFEQWDSFNERTPDCLAAEGTAILRYQQQQVDAQCANAAEIEMDGHKVLCVNAPMLISEIAGQLAKDRPFGVTFFILANGDVVYSLRSREGGVDVSEIAKKHGGGGHKHAAGFTETVS